MCFLKLKAWCHNLVGKVYRFPRVGRIRDRWVYGDTDGKMTGSWLLNIHFFIPERNTHTAELWQWGKQKTGVYFLLLWQWGKQKTGVYFLLKKMWFVLKRNTPTNNHGLVWSQEIHDSPAAHGGRSLPMGWYTDGNLCNIHGEEHLASRWRAMLRTGTFFKFATCVH